MCAINALLFTVVIFGIPLVVFWHLSIRANQPGGDISGVYRLDAFERFTEMFPILYLTLAIAAYFGIANLTQNINKISASVFGSIGVLGPLLFWMPIVLWAVFTGLRQRGKVHKWLAQQGLKYVKVQKRRLWEDPWSLSAGVCSSGTSDSQTIYKIIVEDAKGEQHAAFILWGGYFGMEWLTGEIPAKLVWEKQDESEKMFSEAAERVASIRKKDPADLMKPRC